MRYSQHGKWDVGKQRVVDAHAILQPWQPGSWCHGGVPQGSETLTAVVAPPEGCLPHSSHSPFTLINVTNY